MNIIKSIFKKKKPYVKSTHDLHGHKFTVLDPFTMPKIRQAAYHLNEYEKGWGITKENLILTFEALKKQTSFPKSYHSNEDLVAQLTDKNKDINGIIDMLLMVIQQDYQFDPFIKSACNIVLIDDEPADEIRPEYLKKKLELCKKHEDIMVFFLIVERHSMEIMSNLYDILATSEPLSYPQIDKMREQRLMSLIKR